MYCDCLTIIEGVIILKQIFVMIVIIVIKVKM